MRTPFLKYIAVVVCMIGVSAVSIALAAEPKVSESFYMNVRPLDDFDQYFDFVRSMAEALSDHGSVEFHEIVSYHCMVFNEVEFP